MDNRFFKAENEANQNIEPKLEPAKTVAQDDLEPKRSIKRDELEAKRDVERAVTLDKVINRKVIAYCRSNFTMKKLVDCKEMFKAYIGKYGEGKPFQTSYSGLNSWLNYGASFTGVIRTNQPFAKKVCDLIDKAEKNENKLPEALVVFNTLIEIKSVYTEMKKLSGDVKKSIAETLRRFKFEEGSRLKLEASYALGREPEEPVVVDIANIITFIDTIDCSSRIDSPAFLPY